MERGLTKSIADIVRPPAKHDTLKWILRPEGGTFLGKVCSDGTRLDGPSQLLARNGWAFVVIDFDGNLIAAASGSQPAGSKTSLPPKLGPSRRQP